MSGPEIKYRHEYKYPISDIEAVVLKQRLKNTMSLDPHVESDGMYTIKSLYFDDYYNTCYYENENGTDPREKFRIRIYNNNLDKINLECKRKERGKTLKTVCEVTKEQVEDIIHNVPLKWNDVTDPVLGKFIEAQRIKDLKPKVIVEYKRIPYVYKIGNVRVTFDSHLASSGDIENFLTSDYPKRPVLPVGKLLLEVKFDELLPDYLYDIMQLNNLTQTAFSKYYLCRKYGFKNL